MDDLSRRDAPGDRPRADDAGGGRATHPRHAISRDAAGSGARRDDREGRRPREAVVHEVVLAPPPTPPPPAPPGAQLRRLRRLVAGGIVLVVTGIALGDAVRSRVGDDGGPVPTLAASPVDEAPPKPVLLARRGAVPLYLPIRASELTTVLYHDVEGSSGLALEPFGAELDAGLIDRLEQRIAGPQTGGVPHYVAGGTGSVDVGASAGTDVWSPVDGTVVSVVPNVIDGARYGDVISIQPQDTGLVVVVTHVEASPTLRVGDRVAAKDGTRTRLGTVADLAPVLDQELRRFTQDAGNHVHVEVRPNLPLALP